MSEDDCSTPDSSKPGKELPANPHAGSSPEESPEPSVPSQLPFPPEAFPSEKFQYRPANCAEGIQAWNEELVRIAKSFGSGQDWEDVYQSMCTELCRSWHRIAAAESPLAYALRIATRTKDALRAKQSKNQRRELLMTHDDADATEAPSSDRHEEALDLAKLLLSVLQELPLLERNAYEYVRIQEYTYNEVAEILELSPDAVTNLLRKVDKRIEKARERSKKRERSKFSLCSAPLVGRLFRRHLQREACTDTAATHSASPKRTPRGYEPGSDPLEAT